MSRQFHEQNGIIAFFEKNEDQEGLPRIQFFDPCFVRSELISFERKSGAVHALLHENMHYIGKLPEDMVEIYDKAAKVDLFAEHYTGRPVKMKAALSKR